jgi:hypothetical protein
LFKAEKIRKISLTLTVSLLLSIMLPVLAFAASLVNLVYDQNTGKLSGTIYSQQQSVQVSVYSSVYSNGKEVFGTPSGTVTNGTYKTVLDDTYLGSTPTMFIISEGAIQTVVDSVYKSVYNNVYYFINDIDKPAAPTGLTVSAGDGQVSLSWNANTESDLAGYNLYKNGDLVKTVSGTTYTTISSLSNGTQYSFYLKALDIIGNSSEKSGDVQATPQSSGSGCGCGGGGGSTPADDKKVVVNEESLKNGKDGKVAVEIADGKKEVLLPIKAAEIVGSNKLEIKSSKLTALIPTEVLVKLQSLLSGDQLKDAQIKFSFDAISSEDTSKLMNLVNGKGKPNVTAAGDVFDFSLSVITKDGKSIALTTFEKPITLKMKFSDKANKNLLGVYFIGDDGKLEYVGGKLVDGLLVADVFHFSKYAVLEFDKTFADVTADFWASNVIKKLAAKHLIDGVSEMEFAPSKEVTRAEFAAMLVRSYGLKSTKAPAFADVTKADWYFDAVAAAAEAGIVTGKSDTSFAPNETVTREEMAVMVVRAYEAASKTKAPSTKGAGFADQSSVSIWASASVNAAVELKLLSGRDNNSFAPTGKTTRAESAQVLSNLLEK